ncbi:PD-(D/E)XK nuclease family protein [Schaalia cardiffensis]|uniref:RecB family exonuclease n=1 Tax=Schaalia cardiffensis TaxID=181487 RepID=UPI0018E8BD38|nr:PD-(D/E)XK nuclease family protein [Schaalia cardiffensis]MBJ2329560.1 PD-(D/E)XK nuclease family protein [Schaalia cardiffensis]
MSSPTPRTQGLKGPALSASRAKEYERCPYQYRLHVVDKISDPPSKATALGTLVHSVLERLYDLPFKERSVEAAIGLLEKEWDAKKVSSPEVLFVFEAPEEEGPWLESARKIVTAYFSIEDPQWLAPAAREQLVDAVTADGIRLRGFIDRIDRSAAGDLRVVDYKTGRAPSPRFQDEALFQMRFYALLLQLTDRLPARTQLLYLKSGQVLTFDPDPGDIARFSDQISELWGRIEADARRGEFMPRRNPLCNWCGVKHLCPLFEGRAPEPPEGGFERLLRTRVS